MIENYCKDNDIKIKEISSQNAFFENNRSNDIVMPLKAQFSEIDEYYAVTFHELIHITAKCVDLKKT